MLKLRVSFLVHQKVVLEPFGFYVRHFSATSALRAANSTDILKPHVDSTYSYAYGRSSRTLKHLTISDALRNQVKENGSKTAVISHHEGISATFSELEQQVNQVSRVLLNLGVKRGDVVAIWSCNSMSWVTVQYACARVGAVLCTLNPFYKEAELDYGLKKADIKVLFMPGKSSQQNKLNNYHGIITSDSLLASLKKDSCLEHIVYMDAEGPSRVGNFSGHPLQALQRAESTEALTCDVNPDDPAIIMFTSGTTGKPKGAALSHFTVLNNILLAGTKIGFSENTVFSCPLPLFHAYGCIIGSVGMSAVPMTLVLTGHRYETKSLVDAIIKYNCTSMDLTPTMVFDWLDYVEKNKIEITSLKSISAGWSSVPLEVAFRAHRVIKSLEHFRIGYGTTETGPCITMANLDDSKETKLETVGYPLDFVEVKLINPQTGAIVKLGEQGELLARGHNIMLGYWKDEEKTKEAMTPDRWYKTGDMATMDAKGYLKIVGRTKEMVIRGGENIYPREIEDVLHEHPDVLDAYVVGVPDLRMGEECCAWVKLNDSKKELTEDDVKNFLKDKLAYFKVPKYVLFVDSFPLTSTGKAQKFLMREKSCEILGLNENS